MPNTEYERILLKRSTTAAEVPTVAPSTDHTDGTWVKTDIYKGEAFVNLVDEKGYIRTDNGIRRFSITDDSGVIYRKQVTILSAAMLTSNATPILSITAPAANKVVDVVGFAARNTFVSAAYVGAGQVRLRYVGGADISVLTNAFLISGATVFQKGSFIDNYTMSPAAGVEIYTSGANPTVGDGNFYFDILYRIIDPTL